MGEERRSRAASRKRRSDFADVTGGVAREVIDEDKRSERFAVPHTAVRPVVYLYSMQSLLYFYLPRDPENIPGSTTDNSSTVCKIQ
jgi:hypothetical protein